MSYGQSEFGSSRQGSWKLRVALAGMIALVSIISVYSLTTENPVTGEHQRVAMSEQEEIAMGLQAAPEMESQHGGLSPNLQARREVDKVGERLLRAFDELLHKE